MRPQGGLNEHLLCIPGLQFQSPEPYGAPNKIESEPRTKMAAASPKVREILAIFGGRGDKVDGS